MITWGLDTSHWEGTGITIINHIIGKTGKVNIQYLNTFNFQQVRQSGARFVLAKATEGIDIVDAVWEDTARDAKDNKLVNFPYHFYREVNATEQTLWFIDTIEAMFDGIPTVDFEIVPKNKQQTLTNLAWMGNWIKKEYKITPLLYTSPYYLSLFGTLDLEPLLVYNLWLAWWNPGFITNCYPWAGYLARQWTNKGKLPGIKASVDLDYMLDDPEKIVEYSKI